MRPVQILMDEADLKLIDREAARLGTDRSRLMREAMRRYLREADEEQYLASYGARPQETELRSWEQIQVWPEHRAG